MDREKAKKRKRKRKKWRNRKGLLIETNTEGITKVKIFEKSESILTLRTNRTKKFSF